MSRPSSSVPHQCAVDGGERRDGKSICAGSWGAIHGANRAKRINTTTNTMPIAASGLCLAARGSEMETVDNDYCRILGFTTEYNKSVRKFTAMYVSPIAKMHPCTK